MKKNKVSDILSLQFKDERIKMSQITGKSLSRRAGWLNTPLCCGYSREVKWAVHGETGEFSGEKGCHRPTSLRKSLKTGNDK